MKRCVFSGTFDPPTSGHKTVVENCLKIFDEVVVAVMLNTSKTPLFTVEERLYLLNKMFGLNNRIKVKAFNGAAVDLLESENTPFYVRGVRNTVDFEYENQNFFANKTLKNDIITIYIPADQDKLHVSSTLVKNSALFKKDFSLYVPQEIYEDVVKMLENKNV